MAVNVTNLIAAINPKIYCEEGARKDIDKFFKGKEFNVKNLLEAAKSAKLDDSKYIDFIDIDKTNFANAPGVKAPLERHVLTYDSFGEGLEPIYFWLLDAMQDGAFKSVEKLYDNFVTSPGSAQFAEIYTGMGARAGRVQDEASKWLGAANQVLKSILNLIYDLKDFRMRLAIYEKLESKDKAEREAAMLSLKQVWMDTVDMKRGNSSIKALALSQQGGFVTLIDAFMAAEDENLSYKGVKMDLNERIIRLLQQRMTEYLTWLKESESELKKRYEIEKNYLKSQYNTLKLYVRWAKPYLKASKAFEQRANSDNPSLVNSFNTTLFELVLLGKNKYDPMEDIAKGELPMVFKGLIKGKEIRNYNAMMLVEFAFRTAPERAGQGYGFRGKVEIKFTGFAFNDEEFNLFKKCLEQDDMNDVMGLIEGATTDSLERLQLDIDELLENKKKDDKKEKSSSSNDTNPFSALFSSLSDLFKTEKVEEKEEKPEKKEEVKKVKEDSYAEKIIRSQAIIEARTKCYKIYDIYKKTHKMASLPGYA